MYIFHVVRVVVLSHKIELTALKKHFQNAALTHKDTKLVSELNKKIATADDTIVLVIPF